MGQETDASELSERQISDRYRLGVEFDSRNHWRLKDMDYESGRIKTHIAWVIGLTCALFGFILGHLVK